MTGEEEIDVWAEEPGIRLKVSPWHGGVVLTIYEIDGQRTMTATISAHRWKQAEPARGADP